MFVQQQAIQDNATFRSHGHALPAKVYGLSPFGQPMSHSHSIGHLLGD